MPLLPLRERRRRAARWFTLRVMLLMLAIGALTYAAWFAPWTRNLRPVEIEIVR